MKPKHRHPFACFLFIVLSSTAWSSDGPTWGNRTFAVFENLSDSIHLHCHMDVVVLPPMIVWNKRHHGHLELVVVSPILHPCGDTLAFDLPEAEGDAYGKAAGLVSIQINSVKNERAFVQTAAKP